jgi:hypothetical protein
LAANARPGPASQTAFDSQCVPQRRSEKRPLLEIWAHQNAVFGARQQALAAGSVPGTHSGYPTVSTSRPRPYPARRNQGRDPQSTAPSTSQIPSGHPPPPPTVGRGMFSVIEPGPDGAMVQRRFSQDDPGILRRKQQDGIPVTAPRDKKHTCEICGTKWDRISHLEVSALPQSSSLGRASPQSPTDPYRTTSEVTRASGVSRDSCLIFGLGSQPLTEEGSVCLQRLWIEFQHQQ